MKTLKLGLLGYGTVGQGVVQLLARNHDEWKRKTGFDIRVSAIAKRNWQGLDKPVGVDCVTEAADIVKRDDIDVVLELMGGTDLAFDLIMQAISHGKHVVTANKALIADRGMEIFQFAAEKRVQVAFEASVAGGIPIVKSLKEGLVANEIQSVAGIINGTSNYILTAMRNEGRDFDDVLAEAQALGYAEADPTFDIEGIDAAHKLTILASIAFGIDLDFDKLSITGIGQITRQDVEYAEELGYRIKHLGMAIRRENGVEVRVHPTLVPETTLISKVDGVMNAVRVFGNGVGETLFYGAGAGSLPTASAVMADVLGLVTNLAAEHVSPLGYVRDKQNNLTALSVDKHRSANYLRITVVDKPGVMADIARILADRNISIEAILQKEPQKGDLASVVIVTQVVGEADLQTAINTIKTLDTVFGDIMRIHVEHFL
ncbi:MAG: homoserine dehydrogenase [Gammaproteobacteria bacterium]|nr:MAG: homoserine dehydrogenase [Gammaproteobacteria bacterium]